MTKVAICQSNYIPWKGYFDIIALSDIFVIYDEVQYTKNDWRNRNIIKTHNGNQWLTIPVKFENLSQKICDTKIATTNWNKKHLNSLIVNYSKAPNFLDFKEILFELYETPGLYLSDINLKFITSICSYLKIDTKIIDSRELNLIGDKNEKLIDACEKLSANTYISGPAAKEYINQDLFEQSKINLEWMDYTNYKEYSQLFEPFSHNVSIIDLLLNTGRNSRNFLKY
jgi:hypothetical protein